VGCPAGGYTPAADVPTGSGITYNAGTGDLTVSFGNILTLFGPGPYYFHNVTLWGGSTLILNTTSHIDIYISRKLDCSGGGIVNTSALPTNLSIWGCGADIEGWTLSGGSGAYLALYAPHHPITISGSGALYGSMMGASISSTGGSHIHYDEALTRQPGIGKYMVVSRSWTELSP
jgi:hypothetical protein